MNIPIIYLIALSIFFSIVLFFYNRYHNRANLFLSGYFFCCSLFLSAQYFICTTKSIAIIAYFTTVFSSLFFLIGPFAYFYVRSMFRDNVQLSKKDYLHFVLFVIIFIGALPFLFSSWEYKCFISYKVINHTYMDSNYNINYFVSKEVNKFLKPLFSIFYLILVAKEFIENRSVYKSFSNARVIKIWLVMFLLIDFLTFLFYFIAQFAYCNNSKFLFDNQWLNIVYIIAFIHFAFILSIVLFPQILYGLPISKPAIANPSDDSAIQSIENSLEYIKPIEKSKKNSDNSNFSTEYLLKIESIINNWIEENKYLEHNATLDTFSKYTNIPVHHLSYYFNFILKIKYTDWRNTLRIKHAKVQIDAGINKSITLEALAIESGFATQSTFIKCFKNVYGCTPSEYIKNKMY